MIRALSLYFFITLFPVLLAAGMITGRVVGVTDGDTVKILTADKKELKVRLYGIDTPEKAQAFGQAAKKKASELAFGKDVRVEVVDTDRYGRSVGILTVGEGSNSDDRTASVNEQLVAAGLAWRYTRYCKKEPLCATLGKLEQEARTAKRGLWADPDPTPPWEWRKEKKGKGKKIDSAEAGDQPSQKLQPGEGEGEDTEPDLYREILRRKEEELQRLDRERPPAKEEGLRI